MSAINTTYYDSPCGRIILGAIGGELCLCDWAERRNRTTIDRRLERLLGATMQWVDDDDILRSASRELNEYFRGERTAFDIPLRMAGTDFQQRVWHELCRIPYGETASYATIAMRLGMPKAVRAVANANGANAISIFVPCHRIIGSDGTLTGYAGGLAAKSHLLSLETNSLFTHADTQA